MSKSSICDQGSYFSETQFRPLSLDIPKPLFPIAGFPLVQHHIEACSPVEGLREILPIEFFQPTEQLNRFIQEMEATYTPTSHVRP